MSSVAWVFTWERLRVFEAVARLGSVRAAAQELHVTGSAVSQHIRRLEREAGCELVEPDGRGIRLTHAGRVLSSSVSAMVTAAHQARRDLAEIGGLVAGPLRIGAVASALRALVPRTLLALKSRHPRLEFSIRDGEAADMLPELRSGQLDAVVMESWTHAPAGIPSGIRTHALADEQALLAVHEDDPLAGAGEVPLEALHGRVWASCPEGSDAHHALLQLLRRQGMADVRVRFRVADYATQLQLVAAGLTTALVPRMAITAEVPGVRWLRCRPAVSRTIAAATAPATETPAVHALIAEMTRAAQALTAPGGGAASAE
nr:LysR family transcriptional regulator [Streptomyces albus]